LKQGYQGDVDKKSTHQQAIFFKDDTQIRGEDLQATVEAVRISSVSRTQAEISGVQSRVSQCSAQRMTYIPLAAK
jgi:hypothetical protein